MIPPLVVVDTMVVVSAVIGDPDGPSAELADEVSSGGVRLAISDRQLSELVRVFGYPEVEGRTRRTVRAFEVGLDIGFMGIMHHPRRHEWPSLSDPKDYWILDLAYASDADCIVSYDAAVKKRPKPQASNASRPKTSSANCEKELPRRSHEAPVTPTPKPGFIRRRACRNPMPET